MRREEKRDHLLSAVCQLGLAPHQISQLGLHLGQSDFALRLNDLEREAAEAVGEGHAEEGIDIDYLGGNGLEKVEDVLLLFNLPSPNKNQKKQETKKKKKIK